VTYAFERTAQEDRSKYGFERLDAQGWSVPAADEESRGRAVSSAEGTNAYAFKGSGALKLEVVLDGSPAGRAGNHHKGEALIRFDAKAAARSLQQLGERELTAVLHTDELTGHRARDPIWARLFAEPCDPHSGRLKESEGEVEHFDSPGTLVLRYRVPPTFQQICQLGVQIGLADNDPSKYTAAVYLDAVDWNPTVPPFYVRHRLILLWFVVIVAASLIARIEASHSTGVSKGVGTRRHRSVKGAPV
jgi:hypothetical protein